jgi:hypothetical protein
MARSTLVDSDMLESAKFCSLTEQTPRETWIFPVSLSASASSSLKNGFPLAWPYTY